MWRDPRCIGGDFNVVGFPRKRRNSSRIFSAMRRFSEIIEEFHTRDLPLARKNHFNGLFRKLLLKPTSDHAPILMDGCRIRIGKTPFRFENMWLREKGFKDLVKRWWTSYTFSGSFSHIFACKLKAMKQDLKTWNKEVIGNVSSNKEAALS